jgi:hypothetical protein
MDATVRMASLFSIESRLNRAFMHNPIIPKTDRHNPYAECWQKVDDTVRFPALHFAGDFNVRFDETHASHW